MTSKPILMCKVGVLPLSELELSTSCKYWYKAHMHQFYRNEWSQGQNSLRKAHCNFCHMFSSWFAYLTWDLCDYSLKNTSLLTESIQLGLMHVKLWVLCISGTLFCIAHLFLPFQALDFLLNMLHPHSTINLPLSAFAFLLVFYFLLLCTSLSSLLPVSNSPPLTQINLSSSTSTPSMKHTNIHVRGLALTHLRTQTHNPPGSSHKGPILINLLLYWCWVSLAEGVREGEEGEEGGAGQKTQRSPEGRREEVTDCSHIMNTRETE